MRTLRRMAEILRDFVSLNSPPIFSCVFLSAYGMRTSKRHGIIAPCTIALLSLSLVLPTTKSRATSRFTPATGLEV